MIRTMLNAVTTTGAGAAVHLDGPNTTFQAHGVTSAGTGAAAINVDVSNDGSVWTLAGTLNLTLGTTRTSDAITIAGSWPFARGNVTSISGTDAAVTLTAGR